MHLNAKSDYAVRAALAVAARAPERTKIHVICDEARIPVRFAQEILSDLRRAGVLRSVRGPHGGYEYAGSPTEVTIAEILRAVGDPIVDGSRRRLRAATDSGVAVHVPQLWDTVERSIANVLENTTVEDLLPNV